MSVAPAGLLPQLRDRLRADVGPPAFRAGRAFDEFCDSLCRCWCVEHWTRLARSQPESQREAVQSAKVLIAKVREDVEAMWGDSQQLRTLYGSLGEPLVGAFARLWFDNQDNRNWIRGAIREARKT